MIKVKSIRSSSEILMDCRHLFTFSKVANAVKLLFLVCYHLNMGANCSSHFHEHDRWNNVDTGSGFDSTKTKKRGLYFRMRTLSDPTSNTSADVCLCRQQMTEHRPDDKHFNIFCKTTSLNNTSHHKDTSSSTITSSGSANFSRILGSVNSRSSAKSETSPQRLLIRRSYSPNYRSSSLESRAANSYPGIHRLRSQSWSNGKLVTKDHFKAGSPPLKTSLFCPVQNPISSASHKHPRLGSISSYASSNSPPNIQHKSTKFEEHCPECPLHKRSFEVTKSPSLANHEENSDDLSDDWTPITRRRAASESVSSSHHRHHLSRTVQSTDSSHAHDHAHVHWADEENGSCLSTSIFLSNVRPRSYSHGAMDNPPQRPILKKIAGS